MRLFRQELKLSDIVSSLEGELLLQEDIFLQGVSSLKEPDNKTICFYESPKYQKLLSGIKTGLLIAPRNFDTNLVSGINIFLTDKPSLAFNQIVIRWLELEEGEKVYSIAQSATIGDNSSIPQKITIKDNCVIGDNVIIGSKTHIGANVVIGDDVKIGDNCLIHPNVTIYPRTEIGNNVILHSSCTIGSDGFGYIFAGGKQEKVYHTGKVILHDNVEVGANTTIDRATIGATIIGEGTKIDNLVQIGHNCIIGKHSILCSQVGLAGHTEIGDFVYLAGQVGVAGHLKIGDRALIGAQSGVAGNVPDGAKFFGSPAIDAFTQKKIIFSSRKLPEMLSYFNKIIKKFEE